jgi:MFS family permease
MARRISESTKIKFSSAFQRLWTASAASNLADGLLKTAAPLLATTLTKDPFWISTIAALSMLPWLFFAIPIGGLVDRINRRTMLAVANTLRLIAVIIIATTTGLELITLPILLGAIFIFGVGEVIYDTTLQSMMPEVLTKDQLDRGNARLQIVGITLAEFVGAPVSGLLFAASIALPFYFGGAGILLAVFLVLAIPRAYSIAEVPAKAKAPTGFWEDVRFGIRYLYEDKVLLKLVLLTSSIGFFFSASSSTMVLFLTETLQTPIALFGFLFATPAIGALVGSLVVPKISAKFGRTTTMAWSILLSSVLVFIQGFSPNYWVLAALVSLGSMVITGWNILLMSTYHQIIPGALFGRIHGTRRTLVWGLMPIGSLLGGVLASIDLRLPFIAGGIACSVLALWGFRFIVNLETAWTKKESSN